MVWQFLKKLNIALPYDLAIPLWVYTQTYTLIFIIHSIIHNSQKVEITQASTDGWINEQNVVNTNNWMLLSL